MVRLENVRPENVRPREQRAALRWPCYRGRIHE